MNNDLLQHVEVIAHHSGRSLIIMSPQRKPKEQSCESMILRLGLALAMRAAFPTIRQHTPTLASLYAARGGRPTVLKSYNHNCATTAFVATGNVWCHSGGRLNTSRRRVARGSRRLHLLQKASTRNCSLRSRPATVLFHNFSNNDNRGDTREGIGIASDCDAVLASATSPAAQRYLRRKREMRRAADSERRDVCTGCWRPRKVR